MIKNGPSGITILNPLWNCPWLSGEVLQCPGFFHLCMHLLQVLVFLVIIRSLQHSQATFGAKFKKNIFRKPVLDTVPVELRGAVLQCLCFSHCVCMFLQLIAFFKIIYIFAIVFCTFWHQKQVGYI